jgi:hypothetical protein
MRQGRPTGRGAPNGHDEGGDLGKAGTRANGIERTYPTSEVEKAYLRQPGSERS